MGSPVSRMDASSYFQSAIVMFYSQLSCEQQRDVLMEAQGQLGVSAMFLEKDYWVCRVLVVLFQNQELRPYSCFRGVPPYQKYFIVSNVFLKT